VFKFDVPRSMKINVFWDITPCRLVERYKGLGQNCCTYFEGRRARRATKRRWTPQVPLRSWYSSTRLHDITFHKTEISY